MAERNIYVGLRLHDTGDSTLIQTSTANDRFEMISTTSRVAIGSGTVVTGAINTIAIGTDAAANGAAVLSIGHQAGQNSTQINSTYSGYQAGKDNLGSSVTANGYTSAHSNSGDFLTACGNSAAHSNSGVNVTANGYQSARNNTGASTTANGYQSAYNNTGANVTANGALSAYSNTGLRVTANGYSSAQVNTGSSITSSGYQSAQSNTGDFLTSSGYQSARNNTGARVTSSGYASTYSNSGANITAIGHASAQNNTGNHLTANGYQVAQNNTGANVTANGALSAQNNSGDNTTNAGYYTGRYNLGDNNSLFGYNRGYAYTKGGNTGIGGLTNTRADSPLNATSTKSFSNTDITTNTLTILNHGFGVVGETVLLSFIKTSGVYPTGIASDTDYPFIVTDINTLTLAGLDDAGAGTYDLTAYGITIENSSALGYDALALNINAVSLGAYGQATGVNSAIINTTGAVATNDVANTFTVHSTDATPDFGSRAGVLEVREYTIATLPTVTNSRAGLTGVIIVTDEVGGRTMATSDGTNWRRVSDGNIIA